MKWEFHTPKFPTSTNPLSFAVLSFLKEIFNNARFFLIKLEALRNNPKVLYFCEEEVWREMRDKEILISGIPNGGPPRWPGPPVGLVDSLYALAHQSHYTIPDDLWKSNKWKTKEEVAADERVSKRLFAKRLSRGAQIDCGWDSSAKKFPPMLWRMMRVLYNDPEVDAETVWDELQSKVASDPILQWGTTQWKSKTQVADDIQGVGGKTLFQDLPPMLKEFTGFDLHRYFPPQFWRLWVAYLAGYDWRGLLAYVVDYLESERMRNTQLDDWHLPQPSRCASDYCRQFPSPGALIGKDDPTFTGYGPLVFWSLNHVFEEDELKYFWISQPIPSIQKGRTIHYPTVPKVTIKDSRSGPIDANLRKWYEPKSTGTITIVV